MVTLPLILDGMSNLATRSVEVAINLVKNQNLIKRDDEPPSPPQVPHWAMAVFATTFLLFLGLIASYGYTIGDLIGTLTMVETPTAEAIVLESNEPDHTLNKNQEEAERLLETGPTVALVPVKPITSSLRTTLRHLKANAGRLSRWRGIVPCLFYAFFVNAFSNVLASLLPRFEPVVGVLTKTVAAVAFARLHMAWTHAMISMPSQLTWYQRLAPLSAYKQLWLPTLVSSLAIYVSLYLTVGVVRAFHSVGFLPANTNEAMACAAWKSLLAGLTVFAFGIFVTLAIVLPAHATLIRVEASMLPEDQETIVPFDRSFNGKVVPAIIGGSGAIGFVDAWKTFNWEARRRLVVVYVKNAMVQTALVFGMLTVLSIEVYAFMGKDIQEYAQKYREWAAEHQGM